MCLQVGEVGYNPYLTLPRGGGMSREHITPINEEEDSPPLGVLEDSAADHREDSVDTLEPETEPILAGSLEAGGQMDIQTDGQTDVQTDGQTDVQAMDHDGGQTELQNHDQKPQPEQTSHQEATQPSAPSNKWPSLGKLLLVAMVTVLLSLLVLAALAVVTDINLPVVSELRDFPAIHSLRRYRLPWQ